MLPRSLSWMTYINRNHIYGLCVEVWEDIIVNISLARCRVLMVCTIYLSKCSATGGLGLILVSFFPQKMPVYWMWGFTTKEPLFPHLFRAVMDLLNGKAGRERSSLGAQGEDKEMCLCWTGTSWTIFLQEFWKLDLGSHIQLYLIIILNQKTHEFSFSIVKIFQHSTKIFPCIYAFPPCVFSQGSQRLLQTHAGPRDQFTAGCPGLCTLVLSTFSFSATLLFSINYIGGFCIYLTVLCCLTSDKTISQSIKTPTIRTCYFPLDKH